MRAYSIFYNSNELRHFYLKHPFRKSFIDLRCDPLAPAQMNVKLTFDCGEKMLQTAIKRCLKDLRPLTRRAILRLSPRNIQ